MCYFSHYDEGILISDNDPVDEIILEVLWVFNCLLPYLDAMPHDGPSLLYFSKDLHFSLAMRVDATSPCHDQSQIA